MLGQMQVLNPEYDLKSVVTSQVYYAINHLNQRVEMWVQTFISKRNIKFSVVVEIPQPDKFNTRVQWQFDDRVKAIEKYNSLVAEGYNDKHNA